MRFLTLLLPVALGACGIKAIEDGATLGSVKLRQVAAGFTSTFVAEPQPGVVVWVDTANDEEAGTLLAELERRGLPASAVKAILLTHHHGDHVAGVSMFPDARVYAHEFELAALKDANVTVSDVVKDGQVLEVEGLRVEVFHTPGHTAGHAAYLVGDVLVLGDALVATKDGGVKLTPKSFAEDHEQMDRTVRALAEELRGRTAEVAALGFCHSGALDGVDPLLAY